MARQYYFKSWEEASYLMWSLDCYGVEYEVECGVNLVEEGYDNLVTLLDERGVSIAESTVELIDSYPYEQYEEDKAKAISEGENPRCIMSYRACLAYEEWEAERGEWQEDWDELLDEQERDRATAAEVAERDETIAMVEVAEESALSELAAFGSIEFETGVPWNEWVDAESVDAAFAVSEDELLLEWLM